MSWASLRQIVEPLDLDSDIEVGTGIHGGTVGGTCSHEVKPTAEEDGALRENHQAKRARTSNASRSDRGQAAANAASSALSVAADAVFDVLVTCTAPDGQAQVAEPCITSDALRVALARFRIPVEKCRDDEADDLLAFAADKIGVPPGPLSRHAFGELVSTLGLKVTKDGKVW
mmetsp:Transcript_55912/g.130927  ORF Transcript_55912/g.130927 Transcript_55912/m.130927 type:complete len:173 (-) Transcript_55912:26-544(-)